MSELLKNKVINIYVSQRGDDKKGNGSKRKPFKTYQRAVESVPLNIPEDVRYVISQII